MGIKNLEKDLTIVVKTFERPSCLQDCLESINNMYPSIKVIVADDSLNPQKNDLADEYYLLPHDSGLSYGRNFLLKKVDTPYVMVVDDDTKFITNNCIEMMLNILYENEDIDLVAGCIPNNRFKGILHKDGEILYKLLGKHRDIINGNKIYDIVINLFIAKTDKIKEVSWDNELKICEHTNFFYRAKNILKSTVCEKALFLNSSATNEIYFKFRTSRIDEYTKKQCESLNVKEIKQISY